ncbi:MULTISPECIES: Lsa family ABC-F type ribosomal protection protein [unclassified Enterococcus]|uniref:Lsa family ABC-F type ribosomal protection protein n=1 Tax=unclassified Enterococcus TaxID=2608891 RepID=UPI001A90CF91|nr:MULTISPECIES: Lsa family ABC-F type ribosomal protection protein [unclassified Enterococcus]MBO0462510.1 Lsa family ABC-F type ribosomal protection protein [Enterococcus sp. DIV1298c]MBO1300232.1 Lsa family ABC-F type ribosomal protection protein [Enterococcus sp. DIV1271a]
MSKIEIKQLTFGYDSQENMLFDQAELNIDTTWKLGLIGRNGRGKTTLLNILQNKLPYQGQVIHQQEFVYFPQQVKETNQLTYDVLLELSNCELWEIERELMLMQTDPEILWRPYASLSGGEKTKVLLALLFTDDQHFPLIDEPTNHLDVLGRRQVAEYLHKKKQGFIVVSHDRQFIDEVVDHILVIEKSQLEIYQGNYSIYEEQKRRKDEFELAQNQKIKKEVTRLKKTAAEKAEWSRSREGDKTKKRVGFIDTEARRVDRGSIGADAARTMKRSKAIVNRMENQISEKEKLLKDLEYIDPLNMFPNQSHHKRLLTVENLQLGYEEMLFEPVSFSIEQQQCIAITGPNGSGKSSIIQYLLGDFNGQAKGEVLRPATVSISYVRQNYEDNTGTLTSFAQNHQLDLELFLNNLRKLGMERDVFHTRIENMSMGQRKKVELAKSFAQSTDLYIWDEPLNYLDVFNQEQIEQLLLQVKPAMLIVDHDQRFLEKVATQRIDLQRIK